MSEADFEADAGILSGAEEAAKLFAELTPEGEQTNEVGAPEEESAEEAAETGQEEELIAPAGSPPAAA
jgi:hypothetical protein